MSFEKISNHLTEIFEHTQKAAIKAAEKFQEFSTSQEVQHLMEVIKQKGNLLEEDINKLYEKSKDKFREFLKDMQTEGAETKEAFQMMADSVFNDKKLTDVEKEKIGNQMKDLLKTVGFVGLVMLPGGTLFFILAHFLKLSDYITPSAFRKDNKKEPATEQTK